MHMSGSIERGAYVAGTVAGLGFFGGVRGLFFPWSWNLWFLLACSISALLATWLGLVRRGDKPHCLPRRQSAHENPDNVTSTRFPKTANAAETMMPNGNAGKTRSHLRLHRPKTIIHELMLVVN